ncbi:GNAT family N-acetyltransferase [Candidatus Clostridium stratigraminis]|uniref:GNAT family N-acetyltransferase n=1 Tax=Candidatus Clostridium stratigraminis TaxID=3381661 RepID=A0ABW8T873_9CLOT
MNWELKKFKDLKVQEIYKILEIRNEVFIVEQQCPYQDCDGKDENAYHLYLQNYDKVIAYSRILNKGVSYDEISIGRVLVDKNYRGKGISREMMLKAINFIEFNLNEKEIRIQAQSYLVDFYKSLGFKETSDVYLEDNIPHIDMLYRKIE